MTADAYIQITWGELNRLGNRQLRETLARRPSQGVLPLWDLAKEETA